MKDLSRNIILVVLVVILAFAAVFGVSAAQQANTTSVTIVINENSELRHLQISSNSSIHVRISNVR